VGHRTEKERAANAARNEGWKEVLADKTFVKFWFVAIGAIFFGYSTNGGGIYSILYNPIWHATKRI